MALSLTTNQIIALDYYIAAYGRAPAMVGLKFFGDQLDSGAMNEEQIRDYMMNNEEAQLRYPDTGTAEERVNTVFQNVLGRQVATDAGMKFYTDKLAQDNYDMADLMADVLAIAKDPENNVDGDTLTNKAEAAEYYLETIPADQQQSLPYYLDNVSSTESSVREAFHDIDGLSGGVNLTAGVDKVSGNIFNAERVFDPSGDDQMNSLQDDDVLTGTGDNPTLNFNYITDTQTFDNDISPTLNGIETINIKATDSFAGQLDVQDATGIKNINMTRMDATFTIDNIVNAQDELSVANSNEIGNSMNFIYTDAALSGTEDSVQMTLSNAQLNNLRLDSVTNTEGYETIDLVSTGAANRIDGALNAEDLKTLNITGDQNLRIDDVFEGGSLTNVDASELTANLDFNISNGVIDAAPDGTSSGDVAFNLTSGTGDDTIRVADQIGATDTIAVGEGTDKLIVQAVDATNNYTAVGTTITGVEAVELLNSDPDNAVIGILADEIDGDQTFTLRNNTDGAGNTTVYNVMNLSSTEAKAITLDHSGNMASNPAASSSNIRSNQVFLDVADGVTEAAITIGEGVDTDVRFNFGLYTDSDLSISNTGVLDPTKVNNSKATNAVTSLTINDGDNEDNTILLGASSRDTNDVERGWGTSYTDTITITGGATGNFLNLDAVQNSLGLGYGFDTSGTNSNSNTTTTLAANRDTDVSSVFIGSNAVQDNSFLVDHNGALVATTITSTSVSDIVLRVGSATQAITTGAGNDTIVFDNTEVGTTTLSTAGLTSADKVTLGAGTDTIVIDGANTGAISLGSSEWSGLSGVDVLRLGVNNGVDANGNSYLLQVTNELIDQTDSGSRITIINNDGDLSNNSESNISLNLTGLLASNSVTFEGADSNTGANATSTVILDDVSINSNFILNGGDNNTVATVGSSAGGNGNTLIIQDTTIATVDDLTNITNFDTVTFISTKAVDQTLTMTLTDSIVGQLVDDSNTPRLAQNEVETLTIDGSNATGSTTSNAILNIDASALTAVSSLNITSGAGADQITLGGGADNINFVKGLATHYTAASAATAHTATAAATAATAANDTYTTSEVISGITSGDTINTNNAALIADAGVINEVENDEYNLYSGVYANGVFTVGGANTDTILVADLDNGATMDFETVVLVGVNAAEAAAVTNVAGVLTF